MNPRDLDDYVAQFDTLPFEATAAGLRRRRVLERIAVRSPGNLLEIGCGRHPLFLDLPGMSVTVIEPAPAFADGARRLADARPDVAVVESLAESAPIDLPNAPFDMVVVGCLLHELTEPEGLLAAVRRWCRPSTLLHVNVPNANSLHRQLGVAMGMLDTPKGTTQTQRRMQQRHDPYDLEALRELLLAAGFSPVSQGGILVKPFSHEQMQMLMNGGFLAPRLLEGLDALAEMCPELSSEIWIDAEFIDE